MVNAYFILCLFLLGTEIASVIVCKSFHQKHQEKLCTLLLLQTGKKITFKNITFKSAKMSGFCFVYKSQTQINIIYSTQLDM